MKTAEDSGMRLNAAEYRGIRALSRAPVGVHEARSPRLLEGRSPRSTPKCSTASAMRRVQHAIGAANRNQLANPTSPCSEGCPARTPFGGVPTSVAMPPPFAANAMPSSTARCRLAAYGTCHGRVTDVSLCVTSVSPRVTSVSTAVVVCPGRRHVDTKPPGLSSAAKKRCIGRAAAVETLRNGAYPPKSCFLNARY